MTNLHKRTSRRFGSLIQVCLLVPLFNQPLMHSQSVSNLTYELTSARVAANRSTFYIYQDQDSGFNHGFPSGFFGNISALHLDTGCIDDATQPNGCSNPDPARLDRVHGTVLRVTFDPLPQSSFAGLNIEEPENWGVLRTGQGYDLRGATNLLFDVRSPNGATVQFGVDGCVTSYMSIPSNWTTMSIPLSSLGSCSADYSGFSNAHILFAVATKGYYDGTGATVLLDNIRFEPAPTSRQTVLGFPLGNQTFGVVPVQDKPIPSDQVLRNLSTIYESSLAGLTLLGHATAQYPQDLVNAGILADTFDYAVHHDSHGDPLPSAPDGSVGAHNGYEQGDIALLNSQYPPKGGMADDVRLAGFTATTLCPQTGFCLVLDGATGGNNAFVILSLLASYERLNDVRYLDDARMIGRWIIANLTDPTTTGFGGYFLGYPDEGAPKSLQLGKSLENNADIFSAFQSLATVENQLGNPTAAAAWITASEVAGDFVMQMFDPANGRFNAGTVPPGTTGAGICPNGPQKGNDVINTCDFLDSNTFTTLALASSPRYRGQIDWRRPVQFVLNNFAQTITVGSKTFQGFDIVAKPSSGSNGIAWEFTAQEVAAMRLVDRLYGDKSLESTADKYMSQIAAAQISAPFGDGMGLVASTLDAGDTLPVLNQCLDTPFQCIAERVGLAATTWAGFADLNVNPFLVVPQLSVMPASGNGRSQSFAIFSGALTLADIPWTELNISSSTNTTNACDIRYEPASNSAWLRDDNGALLGPVVLGGTGVLQNSQCSLSASASLSEVAGNYYTAILSVTFSPSYAGAKSIYMETSLAGWQLMGAWTVPPPPPLLSLVKSHAGNFMQGQLGAIYSVTVSNKAGAGPTSGAVTVTEMIPGGLALVSMSGVGWNCQVSSLSSGSCTRSDALAAGSSYPVITVTVDVANIAATPQVNQVSVSGGGSSLAYASDPTTITPSPTPMVLNNPSFELGLPYQTSFTGIGYGGPSAAFWWYVWNGTPGTTKTELCGASTCPSGSVPPAPVDGTHTLHVITPGNLSGVYQIFPKVTLTSASVWLRVVGSGTVIVELVGPAGTVVRTATGTGVVWLPTNNAMYTEMVLYSSGGAAEFYADAVNLSSTKPPPPMANLSLLSPSSGPVGSVVTITGTGFGATQGTSTVAFNGTAATPSAWTDTSIQVSVPSGAATGNVVVTVNGQASNGLVFTVTPRIVTNPSFELGSAIPIQFTGTGNGGAAAATGWSVWNNNFGTTTTELCTATACPSGSVPPPPAAGTHTMHVITTSGASGVYQLFPKIGLAFGSLWLQVVSGAALIELTGPSGPMYKTVSSPSTGGVWVPANGAVINEIVLYSSGGAAEFYVDAVALSPSTGIVFNPSFEAGSSASVIFTGTGNGGASAATGWSVWNNLNGTTTTELCTATACPSGSVPPAPVAGTHTMHVNTTSGADGVYQLFPKTGLDFVSVWLKVVSGTVLVALTGPGGPIMNTVSSPSTGGVWLTANGAVLNEIALYSSNGPAEFYVDAVAVAP